MTILTQLNLEGRGITCEKVLRRAPVSGHQCWICVTLLSLCNAADRRGWFEKNLMEHVSVFRCLDHISFPFATDKTGSKNVLEQEMSGDAVFLRMIYQNM